MTKLWKTVRLKDYAQVLLSNIDKKTYEKEYPVLLCNYMDVYRNKTIHKNIDFMPATASKAQIKRLTLQYHDVIITKDSETSDDIGIPALVQYTSPYLVCGYHLAIIRSKKLHGNFINYLFQSKVAKEYFLAVCLGFTRVSLNKGDILNFTFNIPPQNQQITIANYLDLETSKIDHKLSILNKKFEKLEEYKQSVIFEAVTKGLDKNVAMKDSGIEWIGDIPEHWFITRLKDISSIKKGTTFDDEDASKDGVYPYINGGINPSDWSNFFNTVEDTIAVSEGGASAGYTQFMTTKYWAGAHCYKINSRNKNDIKYIYYLLKGFEKHLMIEKTGSAMPNLQKTRFINFLVSFVNIIIEQKKIVNYLDVETSKIDKKKEIIKKKIALLKEYRKTIIYEAVTGKITIN